MTKSSLTLLYLAIIFIDYGHFLPHELHVATTREPEKIPIPRKQGAINITQSEGVGKENMQINQGSHISDFTNPRTGLNPFLDLVEGAVTGSSRQGATIPDKSTATPKPETQTPTPRTLPPYHRWPPDIMEGPSNPRQNSPLDLGQPIDEGPSRGRIRVFPTNLFPPRDVSTTTTSTTTTTKEPVTIKLFRNIKPSTTRKCEPSKPLPVTQDYKSSTQTNTTPTTIKKREETTREKNISSSSINRNFTIGITIVGVAIIFFTVMLATCLWKQRTKQVPLRHTSLKNMLNSESMKRGMIHT